MSNKFEMGDYIDVAARIVEMRAKYPDFSLQPANPDRPFEVLEIGGQTHIVVVAAAYRTPDDPRPGIGMAYEQFPGRTPYTKGSELQNAETSAWGRAIVAVGAADTKKGIASAEEVRNRSAEREQPQQKKLGPQDIGRLAAAKVDALLVAADRTAVETLWREIGSSPARNSDVSGILSVEDREVLGIDDGSQVLLIDLAKFAGQYVATHGRAVRAPLDEVSAA